MILIWAFGLWDTTGQGELDDIGVGTYANTDVFVLCFSFASQVSLVNVRTMWAADIRGVSQAAFILVGLEAGR
jgi:GTPase SAR1 family protein